MLVFFVLCINNIYLWAVSEIFFRSDRWPQFSTAKVCSSSHLNFVNLCSLNLTMSWTLLLEFTILCWNWLDPISFNWLRCRILPLTTTSISPNKWKFRLINITSTFSTRNVQEKGKREDQTINIFAYHILIGTTNTNIMATKIWSTNSSRSWGRLASRPISCSPSQELKYSVVT